MRYSNFIVTHLFIAIFAIIDSTEFNHFCLLRCGKLKCKYELPTKWLCTTDTLRALFSNRPFDNDDNNKRRHTTHAPLQYQGHSHHISQQAHAVTNSWQIWLITYVCRWRDDRTCEAKTLTSNFAPLAARCAPFKLDKHGTRCVICCQTDSWQKRLRTDEENFATSFLETVSFGGIIIIDCGCASSFVWNHKQIRQIRPNLG